MASSKPPRRKRSARSTTRDTGMPEQLRLVGIGASAGGLEALRDLIEGLPASNHFCYVIAQHLSPSHISMLANLLAPKTELKVQNLTDREVPRAGTIYVTTPNHDVVFENGQLRLKDPPHAIGPKPSVNHLFLSMAEELGDRAIGIVLSGTGSDGAVGMRAIKAAGGTTIVQEPDTAKYDGMPQAAIHTGSIDLILPAGEIGPLLDRLATQSLDAINAVLDESGDRSEYDQVTNLVRLSTGFRLGDYKASTVRRRIARRMGILGLTHIGDYIAELQRDRKEAQALVRDTFISVTSFFRDEAAFIALRQAVFELVETRPDEGVIRCWVPACATGEEAYSIAMLFEEALALAGKSQLEYIIFASDMDDDALEVARRGVYAFEESGGIPEDLRQRFTDNTGGYVCVNKALRNRIIFARQNAIEDPPFARLDLISCRNFLIYLNQPVQQRLMQIFHFALRPGGLLFLGKAENAENHRDMFTVKDARAKLYARGEGTGNYAMPAAATGATPGRAAPRRESKDQTASTDLLTLRTLERLAQSFAPASLVVNEADKVLHFHGDLSPFLSFPQGPVEWDLFELLKEGPRAELRALVYRCRRSEPMVEGSTWEMEIKGKRTLVSLVVSRLDPLRSEQILVSFRTVPIDEEIARNDKAIRSSDNDLIIAELEKELARTRTHLNVVVEELETSNEELQSLNEELQSANEELQSSNEELQTSNEELQSTNEELLTVNEEIQVKSNELEVLARDLSNIKESISFPLIVLDRMLRITSFNRACDAIADAALIATGKSLHEIGWRLEVPLVFDYLNRAISHGTPWSQIVNAPDGKVYNFHIMPYRAARQAIDGVMLIYEDITALHRARLEIDRHQEGLRLLGEASAHGVMAIDEAGYIRFVNSAAEALFGYGEGELVGQRFERLLPEFLLTQAIGPWDAAGVVANVVDVLPADHEVMGRDRQGNAFPVDVQLRRSHSGLSSDVVVSIFDLRPRAAVEGELREAKFAAEAANEAKSNFLAAMSHEIRTPLNVVFGMLELLGRSSLNEQQRAFLEKAEIATRSLRHVIDDILDFSKVEADKLVLERIPFSIVDLIDSIAEQLALIGDGRDIELLLDMDPAIPAIVRGDPLRLHQVLLNLTSNAFKFTQHGRVIVAVREIKRLAQSTRLEFSVSDTGIGIAPESLDAIFEGFTQAENSTTRRFGGTGLGLAISRRLVDLMQGNLSVDSKVGKGSTFRFVIDLPVVKGLADLSAMTDALQETKGFRVLVIDDSHDAADIMARMCRELGWHADVVHSGHEAVTLIDEQCQRPFPYDLLLIDWKMPDLDGWETAVRIREQQIVGDQPIVILVSAYDMSTVRREDDRHPPPFDGFISKPVTVAQLLNAATAINRKRKGQSAEAPRVFMLSPPSARLAGRRILLAEDFPLNQTLMQALLEAEGAEVTIAANGAIAVSLAREALCPFDIVLMDVQMPVMDGFDAARALRQDEATHRLPILAITANALPSDREKCLAAGMDDYVSKPIMLDELVGKIARLIGPAQEGTEPAGNAADGAVSGVE